MLRIGIADDHLLFRKSLSLLVNSFEGMSVVVEAENGQQLISKVIDQPVDVVLLDIQMPVMNGYETCKKLLTRFPDLKVMVVSQLSSRESIYKMMELGAHGYFTKNSNPDQLEIALRSVHEEGFYFGLELGTVIKEALLWEKKNPTEAGAIRELFSEREVQVLKMICKEKRSKEIAEAMFINIRTVESHRKHIMNKSNSKNIVGVILYALKHGIITVDEL